MIYDKLVRDRIPDIIKREGKTPIYWPLNDDDYLNELRIEPEEAQPMSVEKEKDVNGIRSPAGAIN